jgi:D-glycero-D-manno-heptose 1,7-bisphosphate phosphatase
LFRVIFAQPVADPERAAIFLDRDGVINVRRPDDYVLHPSQFVFVPGIREAMKRLATLQLPMILVSNQAAVGKGLLNLGGLELITMRMQQALTEDGCPLTAAYYCTHRSDQDCFCRKPKPGLLREAGKELNIALDQSVFIGDSETDAAAGFAAGCRPILLGRGLGHKLLTTGSHLEDVPVAAEPSDLFGVVRASLCRDSTTLSSDRS